MSRKHIAALAALLMLSGCAGSSDAPVKGKPVDPNAQAQANALAEVDGLRSRVQQLSAQVEELNLQVRSLTSGDGGGGGANSLPELSRRIQKLEGNLKQVASQLGVEIDGQVPAAQQAPATDQGQPAMQQAAPQQPQAQAQAPVQGKAPGKPTDVPAATNTDPAEAIYAKGMQAFQAKEYDKAASMWGDVAKNYPKHTLAPNAYFWMGEAYFQKGDMPQAVLNYQEVIEKFPKSNKAPAAMLKQGMAFQKLNKKEAAKMIFQDLVKKFPDSAEARRAKSLI
ncbi:tol-pal system protein YbgF [Fundidesulfovibrio agrisoli]|uniref:tol-pal system protein YbgF n=1 Tax=Fundidesulfovibrio agrisoli TaxID=2922717 RepID=UPI001FAD64C2|nr:tol-pal system protein YbgF [Fundidesulfovibrio agrisoli]